jgi:branched-chain amino acid transport system permease protein
VLVTLISGLAIGAIYTIVAVGYNLTWLTSKVVNFAFGAFIVSGMFLTIWLNGLGFSPILVFGILVAIGSVVATVEYYVAIRPLQDRGDHAELVTTVGVTTVLQGIIFLVAGDTPLKVPFFISDKLIEMPGGGRTTWAEMIMVAVGIVVSLAAHFWATRTRSGLAALAQSEDRDAALVLGVRPGRIAVFMFIVSGAMGFFVAPFVGPVTFAVVAIASTLAIKGFVVLAIGGLGSQLGALIGGLALGVIEAVVIRVADASYQQLVVYGIFIAVLLFRPQGLFGEVKERTV